MKISTIPLALVLTILFELLYMAICGIKGKENMKIVILAQVLTNPILNIICYILSPEFKWILALEMLVVIIEALLYKYKSSIKTPWLFSIGANIFSYSIGVLMWI